MKKFKVMFEIHVDRNRKEFKEIIVEAGTKKLAMVRALSEINKIKEYEGIFKNIKEIEEVYDGR